MKTWFITGASRGLGRVWAEAALARGDRVAATARDVSTLKPLVDRYGETCLPLRLDVTDRAAAFAAVDQAAGQFGRLDVAINNAGYGLFGTVEEVTEEQARAQLDTNLFGALWVTQAVLPVMRAQGSGHILQVSSIGGIVAFPMVGLYNASKWALEGLSEALAQEVAPLGINVTVIEPGPYRTGWNGPSAVHTTPNPTYEAAREARRAQLASRKEEDPETTAPAILAVVDAAEPPLRIFLGTFPHGVAEKAYRDRLATWQQWRPVGDPASGG